MRFSLSIIILSMICAGAAQAQKPPIPAKKNDSVQAIERQLEAEKSEQKELEQKISSIKGDLEGTRKELLKVTKAVQQNEAKLTSLENRIESLIEEEKQITERLEGDYDSIASLVLALERMRRVPPEALIVKPGAPLEVAQSAMLLRSTLPPIYGRAEKLSADLKRLKEIELSLQNDREDVLNNKEELAVKQAQMNALMYEREAIYRNTQRDYEQNKEQMAYLAREAQSAKDLLNRLKEQNRTALQQQEALSPVRGKSVSGGVRTLPGIGRIQLPAAGHLTIAYGGKDQIGATSQGISLETRPNAVIVAPMGGIVRFADYFKNYGELVIIEHKGGYHSLLSGFDSIRISVGQAVETGEPLGELPSTSSRGGNPALYYELRHKGKPVDPADKFSELKS